MVYKKSMEGKSMSRLFRNKFEDYMNDPDELTPEELKEWDKFVMDCAIDDYKSEQQQSSQEEK